MGTDPEPEPSVVSNLPWFERWAKRLLSALAVHRRIEITLETDRIVIIRRRKSNPDSESPPDTTEPGVDSTRKG